MACLPFNLSCGNIIEQHLPTGTFPGRFISAILIQSQTFVKERCNFQGYDGFFSTNAEGLPIILDPDSTIVKNITAKMTDHSKNLWQAVIVDSNSIDSLKTLLEHDE